MTDSLLPVLLIAAMMVTAVFVRMASVERRLRALSRLEAKLDAILKHLSIRFDPYAEVPTTVLEALHRGQKIDAIKEYRAATGAGLHEAKEYVEEVQRRASPRA